MERLIKFLRMISSNIILKNNIYCQDIIVMRKRFMLQ